MYSIYLPASVCVTIDNCPDRGLAACDYRRAHGLKEEPANRIYINVSGDRDSYRRPFTSEALVRLFAGLANEYADISIHEYPQCNEPAFVLPPDVIADALAALASLDANRNLPLEKAPLLAPFISAYLSHLQSVSLHLEAQAAAKAAKEAEENAASKTRAEARAAEAKQAVQKYRPYLTPEELVLLERDKLSVDALILRLTGEAEQDLANRIESLPVPPGYAAGPCVYSGHKGYRDAHWQPDWVPTILALEKLTGHPVSGVSTDCIHFHTHLTVAWQAAPLPVTVTFETAPDEAAED